ncbi:exosortase B [Jeongeupia chitinilytica]|uniref:Exosortase n=1 Tax=Jeongeupia chitinilytica TaxID=1041641 RepID=A0ABQ3GWY0_9NEIS|nr:exosortase B [Jeongeupia chitinilytica]GHD56378.1 exosortase [Jeongeupia chitinilytica]
MTATVRSLTFWAGHLSRNVLLLVGLAVLAVPTVVRLALGLWETPEQGHGPLILAVVLWLFWHRLPDWLALRTPGRPGWALVLLVPALAAYALGRSQAILLLEVGSFIPVAAALLLACRGWQGVKLYWFALIFMLFLVPLPAAVVDSLTGALKAQVSHIAEVLLYTIGYPVARNGVLLTVGPYQLLVADACSGMNSMFSLLAVGSLYVYISGHTSVWRNALLVAAMLPMAFVANIVRVMVLILVTYHFGDAAGQGFVHGFAGMVLFAIALAGMFLLDRALGLIRRNTGRLV